MWATLVYSMKTEYQIINEEKLLLLKFIGAWSLDDYKKSLEKFLQMENLESINKILSDFREVSSEQAIGQVKELVEIREKIIKKKYTHVRIVNNPLITGLAHLYREELNKKGYLDNYCSTIERAITILNLNIETKKVENLLNNLENNI